MKIYEYDSVGGWSLISQCSNFQFSGGAFNTYSSGNKRYTTGYTNTAAGYAFPVTGGKTYKVILSGNPTINQTSGQTYYHYIVQGTNTYDTSGATNSASYVNATKTYDSSADESSFVFTVPSTIKSVCVSTNSVMYGTSNPAFNGLAQLFKQGLEQSPPGWQEIDPNKRVNGAWTTGSAHKRSSGTWD